MERESTPVRCDICCGQNLRIFLLNKQEQVLSGKICSFISLSLDPLYSCNFCLVRLYQLKDFLKEIYLNQPKLSKIHDEKMEEKRKKEEQHKYDCSCVDCRTKFGALHLLADVIHQKSNEPSTSKSNHHHHHHHHHHGQSAPSTSRGVFDSPSSKSSNSYQNRKEMKCTHCDKVFSHKGDLNKHLRTHTGEQPFFCTVCERRFAHTSNLARHYRLHSGSRPFTCDNCLKTFSRKDKLDCHRKSKTCKKS